VERRRGAAVETLATGTLDVHGRARFALPTLGTLDPLARASSRLAAVPLDPAIRLDLPPANVVGRDHPYGVHTLRLPARLPTGDMTMLLQVVAHVGGTVTGRALSASGEPARDAHVMVFGHGEASATDTCTDTEGRFAIHVWQGGTFDLTVLGEDGSHAERKDVALPSERDVDLGDHVLRGGARYAGRVTYPDGAPAAGVRIELDNVLLDTSDAFELLPCEGRLVRARTWTGADGRFELFTDDESCSLSADVTGDADADLGAQEMDWMRARPRTDYAAVLRGHEVRVVVRDGAGLPVEGARVQLWVPDPGAASEEAGARKPKSAVLTEVDGRARLWLRPGTAWRVVTTADGAVPHETAFIVPAHGNVSELAIVLQPLTDDARLTFRLLDPEGRELLPAVWTVRTDGGTELFSRRVDDPGFTLPVAGGRRYRVSAWATEDPTWRGEVDVGSSFVQRWLPTDAVAEVPERGTHVVTLPTREAAHLQVVLRCAPELAVEDLPWSIAVELEQEGSGRRITRSLTRPGDGPRREILGRFLEPGAWTVRVVERGLVGTTRNVELERGRLARVELVLDKE